MVTAFAALAMLLMLGREVLISGKNYLAMHTEYLGMESCVRYHDGAQLKCIITHQVVASGALQHDGSEWFYHCDKVSTGSNPMSYTSRCDQATGDPKWTQNGG